MARLRRDPVREAARDYYATCMDESKLESGLPELRTELRRIDRMASFRDVATEVARLHDAGANALFAYGSAQDFKDATQVIGTVDQGGSGFRIATIT
jgi:endothelin-converting enzyme/putative endopeptidase